MRRTSRGKRPPRRCGFTLIEVLIAIALALVLGATMFAFLHDMLATRVRTIEHATRQRAAVTLIERLEGDLAACIVGDQRNGAGVRGGDASIRVLTRGVMPQLASRGADDPAALADLHDVEYRFNAGTRAIEARKHRAGDASEFVVLGKGVSHVRFRYLDGRQWRETFDSIALNRLPNAIEVCVWFNPWPGDAPAAEVLAATTRSDELDSLGVDGNEASGNFDDEAFADASERELFRPPPPDRRRVIVIPDSGGDEADASETPSGEASDAQ